MAPLSPNAISAIIKEHLGYVGKVAGEVLYILQCTPKIAILRKEKRCYTELPVLVDNTSYFMSPITRILQRYGEEVDCNPIIPPAYQINNEWFGFTPMPTRLRKDPVELQVDETTHLKFTPMQSISIGGIYTEKEIRQAQDAMLFGMERKAINTIITNKLTGQASDTQGLNMLKIFNPAEIEQLAQSTIEKLWGWFTWLGTCTNGLLGLIFMWKMCKFVLEVIMNAVAIHKVHGFTVKLLASLWDTLTIHVLNGQSKSTSQNKIEKEDEVKEENGLNEISTTPTAPVTYPQLNHELLKAYGV